jgi:D-alanyl-lipoteichoic acid acyltransferase DltB (MBOAT superfamily)
MSWNWKYAALLLTMTGISYFIGLKLETAEDSAVRKHLMASALAVSLGILFIFKYYNFFMTSVSGAISLFGIEVAIPHLSVLLPIGISFYTFQALSYTIDVYFRKIPTEHDFIKFALFVSFFPQLVAGPIVRASFFLPQLHRSPIINDNRFLEGSALIFKGLFKKIVIADLLASFAVDKVFNSPLEFSSIDLLFALYGYAFQIYNDFSGYTDIAIGIGLLIGFDLPENFNRPYLSQNIREFWRRWHITLSTWFRDYVYIVLGGNRCVGRRVVLNLLITMLLCGLWHGAAANFVIWGLYHAVFLILDRRLPASNKNVGFPTRIMKTFVCFHLVTFGWLIFRVTSMQNFTEYIKGLSSFTFDFNLPIPYLVVLCFAVFTHFFSRDIFNKIEGFYIKSPVLLQATTYAVLIVLFSGLNLESPNFIYFQF